MMVPQFVEENVQQLVGADRGIVELAPKLFIAEFGARYAQTLEDLAMLCPSTSRVSTQIR